MEQSPLTDPTLYPDTKVLKGCLGAAMPAWEAFTEMLKTDYPLIETEWRYYNDGKSWLFKATKKKKTVCWVKVLEKYFRIAFYIGNKAAEVVKKSTLDVKLKKQYLDADPKSKFRAIVVVVKKKGDLKSVKELIVLKEKV